MRTILPWSAGVLRYPLIHKNEPSTTFAGGAGAGCKIWDDRA